MHLSLTLMVVIMMVVPTCWRCWFGGVLGRDTESVMSKIEDEESSTIFRRESRESVCLEHYQKESFLRYIGCLRSLRSGRALNLDDDDDTYSHRRHFSTSAASSVTRGSGDNSYFLVGFAFLYPFSMIIFGVMLPKYS